MAKIVTNIGSSHSPALLMEPKAWLRRGETDDVKLHALHDFAGKRVQYDELLEVVPKSYLDEITPEVLDARHAANEAGIKAVADLLLEIDPDIVIMVGDDHKEVFHEDNMPSLSVYWGNTIPYKAQGIMKWKYADDLKAEVWYPQQDQDYPVASEFAVRLIGDLLESGFDPSHSKYYPEGQGMTHSFGYIYHRIMTQKVWPTIPVSINTYYPPNQITPRRAYQLGKAIRAAVESWPEDLNIVVLATGGLSHFVVDEEFDRAYLKLLEEGGEEGHAALPREKLQSGNSEFRCWSVLAGASEGLKFNLIDYVPCYRSPAGTGCGMAFAYWK